MILVGLKNVENLWKQRNHLQTFRWKPQLHNPVHKFWMSFKLLWKGTKHNVLSTQVSIVGNGCFKKNRGFLPKPSIFIRFSMKKNIHFGGFSHYFWKHPNGTVPGTNLKATLSSTTKPLEQGIGKIGKPKWEMNPSKNESQLEETSWNWLSYFWGTHCNRCWLYTLFEYSPLLILNDCPVIHSDSWSLFPIY